MPTPFLVLCVCAKMCEAKSDLHAMPSLAHIPSCQQKQKIRAFFGHKIWILHLGNKIQQLIWEQSHAIIYS